LADGLRSGSVVLLRNHDGSRHVAVGRPLTTKVNANFGTSSEQPDYREALSKALAAVRVGADTLMDLSTVGMDAVLDFESGLRTVAQEAGLPLGTVPIYEAERRALETRRQHGLRFDAAELLDGVARQAEAGVSFMAIHVALNRRTLEVWQRRPRSIVSKGGYVTAEYMLRTGNENPFFERYNDLLDILAHHDVCLNIGSALRSGATRFNDDAQTAELEAAAELAEVAAARGVQVVIEGPGHVALADIEAVVRFQQEVCRGRPFFILGFVATDAFAGHDHIVSAIGAAEAVRHGVSWLCSVTPAEHVRMPAEHDIREGVLAARIAGQVGDCARGQPRALALEEQHSAKACLDRRSSRSYCATCGQDFCPIRRLDDYRRTQEPRS